MKKGENSHEMDTVVFKGIFVDKVKITVSRILKFMANYPNNTNC